MTTSKPHKLIFFKKENCAPCKKAAEELWEVLKVYPEFHPYVVELQKENHQSLVVSFNLEMYPTVLIMDQNQQELSRKVGVRFLTKEWWQAALTAIHQHHKHDDAPSV